MARAAKKRVKPEESILLVVLCNKCKIKLVFKSDNKYAKECGLCGSNEVSATPWLTKNTSTDSKSGQL